MRSAPPAPGRRRGRHAPSAASRRRRRSRVPGAPPLRDRPAPSASECRSALPSRDRRRPRTCAISACTWLASCRSVWRSSPKIFTAMFARVPDSMWSMRCEIGWPIVTFVPGSSDTFWRNLLEHGLSRTLLHRQAHVDLRGLDALHVLVELRAPGAPGRRRHLRHAQQQPLERVAERVRVRQARAGDRDRAHRQRAFVELRQERAARRRESRPAAATSSARPLPRRRSASTGRRGRASARSAPSAGACSRGSVPDAISRDLRQQPRAQHRRHRQRHDAATPTARRRRRSRAGAAAGLRRCPA